MNLTADRIADVLGDRHAVADSLERCEAAARGAVDAELLSLCERRVGELLGVERPVDMPAGELDDAQRACLAFAEHWVIDVATMPSDLVAAVAAELGDDGLVTFAHALLVVEQRLRLGLAWDRLGLGMGARS